MTPGARVKVKQGVVLLGFLAASVGFGRAALEGDPTGAPVPDPAPSRPAVSSETPTASATPTPTRSKRVRKASATPTGKPRYRSGPVTIPLIACGSQTAKRTVRFRVLVQVGLDTSPDRFANAIRDVLCDERSWRGSGAVRFRYDPKGDLLVSLRSPAETERRCMRLIRLSVNRRYSCGTPSEIVINADRWFTGSPKNAAGELNFPRPLREYRQMLINHEVGHALLLGHQDCARDGAKAPVMMQQSKGMRSPNGRTCEPNPWPLLEELDRLRARMR